MIVDWRALTILPAAQSFYSRSHITHSTLGSWPHDGLALNWKFHKDKHFKWLIWLEDYSTQPHRCTINCLMQITNYYYKWTFKCFGSISVVLSSNKNGLNVFSSALLNTVNRHGNCRLRFEQVISISCHRMSHGEETMEKNNSDDDHDDYTPLQIIVICRHYSVKRCWDT